MYIPSRDPGSLSWAGGGQAEKVLAFGRERRRLTSLLGSRLLAAVPFLKNQIHCYFIN